MHSSHHHRDVVRAHVGLLDALARTAHAVVRGIDGRDAGAEPAANWPNAPNACSWWLRPAATRRRISAFTSWDGRQSWPTRAGRGRLLCGETPDSGLSVARMAAHITYLSEEALTKFGRNLQDREAKTFGFEADFGVESYLRYQGNGFTQRFDANSYLYITRAMDYFDLAEEHGGRLADAFVNSAARFCRQFRQRLAVSHRRVATWSMRSCRGCAGKLRRTAARARQLPARCARTDRVVEGS